MGCATSVEVQEHFRLQRNESLQFYRESLRLQEASFRAIQVRGMYQQSSLEGSAPFSLLHARRPCTWEAAAGAAAPGTALVLATPLEKRARPRPPGMAVLPRTSRPPPGDFLGLGKRMRRELRLRLRELLKPGAPEGSPHLTRTATPWKACPSCQMRVRAWRCPASPLQMATRRAAVMLFRRMSPCTLPATSR